MILPIIAWILFSDYSKTHWKKLLYIHCLHFFPFHFFFPMSSFQSGFYFTLPLKPLLPRSTIASIFPNLMVISRASFYSYRNIWYSWPCSPPWNILFTCLPEHHTLLVLLLPHWLLFLSFLSWFFSSSLWPLNTKVIQTQSLDHFFSLHVLTSWMT